ncbi:MAG: nucleotidyltransferase domain-containing protein [Myxococcota bacterium]|nr:nucleotidyltransferase domain-containing protein [Myxococcota bacterium]
MEETLTRLLPMLSSREEVIAACLFGSHARGQAGADSDVDLGLVLRQPWFDGLTPARQARVAMDLIDLAGRAAPDIPLDVVILDAAHPIAAWEAARTGRVLLCRDARAFDEFVLRSLHRYDDWLRLHRIEMEAVRRRLGLTETA